MEMGPRRPGGPREVWALCVRAWESWGFGRGSESWEEGDDGSHTGLGGSDIAQHCMWRGDPTRSTVAV